MQFAEKDIIRSLKHEYGINWQIAALPGELDLNFVVKTETTRYVLKCMRLDCDPAFIDMQIKAMDHIRQTECPIAIPEVILTKTGTKTFTLNGRICWLISFLPGLVMAKAQPWSSNLCFSIGKSIALIVNSMHEYDHPQLNRPLKWNLLNALWIKEHLKMIGDSPRRIMINEICTQFEMNILPKLAEMESVPIYNDANDMNILVNIGSDGEQSVSGIIDFGDMTLAPKVCEPAIAMAYAMMGDGDPIARGAALAAGFHKILPLSDQEIAMLLPLIKMRLANSVTNAIIERKQHPENEYLSISEAPAWALLETLDKLDALECEHKFRTACLETN